MDIKYLEDKLLKNDGSINFEEAMELTNFPKNRILELTSLARKVTLKYKGDGVFLRSIISAKTGDCSEDCSFCSQSVHYSSPISKHSLLVMLLLNKPCPIEIFSILESLFFLKFSNKLELFKTFEFV